MFKSLYTYYVETKPLPPCVVTYSASMKFLLPEHKFALGPEFQTCEKGKVPKLTFYVFRYDEAHFGMQWVEMDFLRRLIQTDPAPLSRKVVYESHYTK